LLWLWLLVGGVGIGVFSGLFGVGGGALLVPLLTLGFGYTIHKAIAISLAVIVPTALSGAYRHSLAGNVEWTTALIIAVGSMVGAYFGAQLGLGISESVLRKLFALILLGVAMQMFFSKG